MDYGDGVCAVVQADIGLELQGFFYAVVVFSLILSPEGIDEEAPGGQGCSHFVLSGEGIGARHCHLCPSRHQGGDEVGRLNSHMQTGDYASALQRFLPLELLLYPVQNRHMPAGPFDTLLSCFC